MANWWHREGKFRETGKQTRVRLSHGNCLSLKNASKIKKIKKKKNFDYITEMRDVILCGRGEFLNLAQFSVD